MEPVDVRVVSTASEELSNLAVEFGGTSNFQAPQIGTAAPVQILTRRPTRYKAVIMIDTLSNGGAVPGSGSISADGTATTPGAATAFINAGTPAAGTYQVYLNFNMAGTPVQATDANNIRIGYNGGTFIPLGNNIGTAQQNFGPFTVTLNGTNTVVVQSIAAGTAGSIYSGTVTLVPVSGQLPAGSATGVMLAYRPDYLSNAANPQGTLITATPKILQWENQQPCYAVAIGGGPVTISVIDQAAAASESKSEEAREDNDLPDQQEGGRDYAPGRDGNEY